MYMFCIVTVERVHVLCCDGGTFTCFVLWRWNVYMFCVVTVERAHILCCDGGTCTCFVLWRWNVYMFCIVMVECLHVLYCDSGTLENKFEKHWFIMFHYNYWSHARFCFAVIYKYRLTLTFRRNVLPSFSRLRNWEQANAELTRGWNASYKYI